MDNIEKTKIEIEVPIIIQVLDYHEFDYMEQLLKCLNDKLVVEEFGYQESTYFGLIHLGTDEHVRILEDLRKEYEND